jgi:hypothetical protein
MIMYESTRVVRSFRTGWKRKYEIMAQKMVESFADGGVGSINPLQKAAKV